MKTKIHPTSRAARFAVGLALLSTLNSQLSTLLAQGTAFTYQGRLAAGANPANGNYDMQFYLRDAPGPPDNPVGPTNTLTPVTVSNGLFTVALDFGANFPGADRWLEIGVRTNGAASYTTLSPRQKLTPAPYAMTAGNLSGTLPASQLSGTVADAQLNADVALLNRSPQTFTGQNIFNSNVGIGTASPAAPLHVKQGSGSGVIPPASAAIMADAQSDNDGIWGASGVANGSGVAGECDNGASAAGVLGISTSGYGVYGNGKYGVLGNGISYGGYFSSGGANGTGVYGNGNSGVFGYGTSYGGYFSSGGANSTGVHGECDNGLTASGVFGASLSGCGVFGLGGNCGVQGQGGTYGLYGSGTLYGGYFASSGSGVGLYASGSPAIFADGKVGVGTSSPKAPLHVKQGSGSGAAPDPAAIVGDAQTNTLGIWGATGAFDGAGVFGVCNNGDFAAGVEGTSSTGYGVYGIGNVSGVFGHGGTYGGYFSSSGGTGLIAAGNPALQTSGSVGINTAPSAALHVQGMTAAAGDNTADFYDPSIGPNHSHIHWGLTGDWYIRSAADAGNVILQDQSASAYVGIGTGAPAYTLDVNGTIRANNVSPSDARWKKNIAPLTRALQTIEQLRGVCYDWRTEEYPKINFEPGPQIGLIAQEVKEILPEAVSQDRDGFYSIAYSKLIPVLVEGIKEQQGQLRAKDAKIAGLEKELSEMANQISEMKSAQRQAGADWEVRFTRLQKAVARLADKSTSTFALNSEPTEAK